MMTTEYQHINQCKLIRTFPASRDRFKGSYSTIINIAFTGMIVNDFVEVYLAIE
ncbi:hypothetical protein QNH23_08365 [Siminovitchia fortis]|uniref:hypothetical protein n=1 Tax=Siminovitchia fortis TaxID=254758 RepID=UPI0013E31C20|nr:hypothetical protein [Siminovitchia fortis]WHY83366.1 hypothetical protein QNH23_08365 [Siminovitchia fortis]